MSTGTKYFGGRVLSGMCLAAAFIACSAQAQVSSVQVAASSTRKIVAVVSNTTNAVVATKVIEKNTTGTWVESVAKSTSATTTLVAAVVVPPPVPMGGNPIINDCNNNGIDDATEIAGGSSDWDNDGRLDICETTSGDFNLNGVVDSQDVSILLGWWGVSNPLYGDLNGDNFVDAVDLGTLLARFGPV